MFDPVLEAFKREILTRRVASRYLEAIEFDSPEALQKYLKDHPNADKTKHKVKKPSEEDGSGASGKKPKKPEGKEKGQGDHADHGEGHDDHGEGHDDHDDGEDHSLGEEIGHAFKHTFKGFANAAKSLSKGAVKFFKESPEVVKKFVTDKEYRKETLAKSAKTLKEMPKKTFDGFKNGIKHTAEEFKDALGGVGNVLTGKKMTKKQKKAFAHLTVHATLAVATAALTGGTAGLAGHATQNFVNATARKIAGNALTQGLGDFVAGATELEHFGHGIAHHAAHAGEAISHAVSHAGEAASNVSLALLNLSTGPFQVLSAKDDDKGDKKDEKLDTKAFMMAVVNKLVHDQLEKLSDEDLAEALNEAAKGGEKKDEKA